MFSKTCQYAIRAVIYLATHSPGGSKVGVKEMADALNVPQQFLAKILQQLARHHLISSIKGPNGGFFLGESNAEVTLLNIVECIDGLETLQACVLGLPTCSSENPCPLHFQFFACREGFQAVMSKWKIESFRHLPV